MRTRLDGDHAVIEVDDDGTGIDLDGTPGSGTTFRVRLPVRGPGGGAPG